VTVPKSNFIDNIIQHRKAVTKSYINDMKCYPRPPPTLLDGRDALKTPWDFYKSVFRTYKQDNKKLLDDCFEVDWPMTKMDKFIKNN